MVYLFIASFALVIYGTLFPFNFQMTGPQRVVRVEC